MTNDDTIDLDNKNIESNSTPSMAVDVETSSAPTNTNESQYDENLKKKRKLTSPAWEHFKKMKVGGVMKAICDHCHKHLGAEIKNGTKHLLDHIAVCPMIKQRDTRQMLLKANSSSDGKCASLDTFMYVPSPHDAENLGDALMECLLDWNIERKLLTLTLDNCSTNDAMVNVMLDKLDKSLLLVNDKLLHIRCATHILNLIVKEGLENLFGSGVERIRDSIAFWTTTPKRLEKFDESVRHLNIPCSKVLYLDINTRWNSTYLMLSTVLSYKDVFSRLRQHEP
ncbi:hypothetical protein UlMin_033205 [Ulmus minor]